MDKHHDLDERKDDLEGEKHRSHKGNGEKLPPPGLQKNPPLLYLVGNAVAISV